MASPIQKAKQPIQFAADGTRISRIRRDPPPIAKKTVVPDRDDEDRRMVPIGIIAFALAIVVSIIGLASFAGWTPAQYTVEVQNSGAL